MAPRIYNEPPAIIKGIQDDKLDLSLNSNRRWKMSQKISKKF